MIIEIEDFISPEKIVTYTVLDSLTNDRTGFYIEISNAIEKASDKGINIKRALFNIKIKKKVSDNYDAVEFFNNLSYAQDELHSIGFNGRISFLVNSI